MRTDVFYPAARLEKGVYFKKMLIFITVIILAVCISIIVCRMEIMAAQERKPQYEDSSACRYYKSIRINAGDTLWDIAEEYRNADEESVTEYIELLKTVNNLDSDVIYEGCYLTVSYFR